MCNIPQFLDADDTITAAKFGARRLPEIKSLWRSFTQESAAKNVNAVAHDCDTSYYESKGCTVSNRHLRRRTGSHIRKRRYRFGSVKTDNLPVLESKPKVRRSRRKQIILQQNRSTWQTNIDSDSHWIKTHLWHTKRFYMSPPLSIFRNWCIPLGHSNRGAKAAQRLVKTSATVQDATWTINGQTMIIKSSSKESLIDILVSICGRQKAQSAPFLTSARVLEGMEAGYGFIYDIKSAFPAGMIGPATFIFGFDEESYWVSILSDVTLIEKLNSMVQEVLNSFEQTVTKDSIATQHKAKALLRVRGNKSTSTIARSIKFQSISQPLHSEPYLDWTILQQSNEVHTKLNHGTVIQVYLNRKLSTEVPSIDEHVADKHIARVNEHFDTQKTITPVTADSILLISQCPNQIMDRSGSSLCAGNSAIAGWDILCEPDLGVEIFLGLNNEGACSISLTEASSMCMEAKPPLPLWPRDYPDTSIGRLYWSNDNIEWNMIRSCVEEGLKGGRINSKLKHFQRKQNNETVKSHETLSSELLDEGINWNNVISTEDNNDSTASSIVVRGNFIAPFHQVLSSWNSGQGHSHSQKKNKKHRPRRKVRPTSKFVISPPLSADKVDQQKGMCISLSQSLSFPALLRCHLLIEGNGSISAGMVITDIHQSIGVLGYVSSGAFSPGRGACHGVGFIVAKKFLSYLAHGEYGIFGRKVESEETMFAVRVAVINSSPSRLRRVSAFLSILH